MMADDCCDFKPVLMFDTDDPEFVRGVQVGHVWYMLNIGVESRFIVYQTNGRMMRRIARALDMRLSTHDLNEHMMEVVFSVKA